MKEQNDYPEQDQIRKLHDCNTEIYKIIDNLKAINVDIFLGFQNLRDATTNIQKAIGTLIDKITNTKTEPNT